MSEGKKNNIHEEGMGIGPRVAKSKSEGEGWIEEDFGKPSESVPPKRIRKKSTSTPRKGNHK